MMKELPVLSKMFCSSSEVVLGVRARPHVVGGGGFVVTDLHSHAEVFRVDGCGVLGKKDQITLTDAYQTPLLLIRHKGGIVEALSLHKQWRGYSTSRPADEKLVFTLKDPKAAASCFASNNRRPVRVSIEQKDMISYCNSFQIKGYFQDKECSIVDSGGNIIAQVGVMSKEMYEVVVKPGIDQAFVVGVIAILDYIHNGSTRC